MAAGRFPREDPDTFDEWVDEKQSWARKVIDRYINNPDDLPGDKERDREVEDD